MAAGEEEGGGRHARRDLPDELNPAADDLTTTPDEPVDAGATQALPVFRRESSGEAPRVRAVAPRVASALPAIGGDEIRDAPASARANIERRRRAQEEETGQPISPDEPAPTSAGTESNLDDVELVPIGSQDGPRRMPAELLGSAGPPTTDAGSDPTPVSPAEPAPLPEPAAVVDEPPVLPALPTAVPIPPVTLQLAAPPSAPGAALLPVPRPEPESTPHIVDAEIIEDPTGEHRAVVVGATAAEMVNALTHIAFREAQTDEWATVSSDLAGHPSPGELLAGTDLEPLPRPGPGLMTADSWETAALPVVPEDSYQGRRRRSSKGAAIRWLVVIAVVLALCAAIAIPFLITSGGGKDQPNSAPRPSDAGLPGPIPSAASLGTDDPYMPIGAASATPTAGPATTGAAPITTTSTTPPPSPSASASSPAGPQSGTLQAEDGTRSGGATLRLGNTVVDRIGQWSCGGCQKGTVRMDAGTLPAGGYTITVYYVFADQFTSNPQSDSQRWGRIEVRRNGGAPTYLDGWYTRSTTCSPCVSKVFPSVSLSQGSYTMTFVNSNGRAPAIDKIVITRNS